MEKTIYLVRTEDGRTVEKADNIVEAVLDGARYDGYGAEFKRGSDGYMYLYTSWKHIGNNRFTSDDDSLALAWSVEKDDETAMLEIAYKLKNSCHPRYTIDIEESIISTETGEIISIGGRAVQEMLDDFEWSLEQLKNYYSL